MISPVSAGGGFTRTGICTMVDMASLEIEVDVNESYINRVRAGQRAVAALDAYPDWEIPAKVITTVPTADRQKATVQGAPRVRPARPARSCPTWASRSRSCRRGAAGEAPRRRPSRPQVLVPKSAVREDDGRRTSCSSSRARRSSAGR